MRGFVVQARSTDKPDSWDNAVFAKDTSHAAQWIHENVHNPDCEVRILPGMAVPHEKLMGEWDIGVMH